MNLIMLFFENVFAYFCYIFPWAGRQIWHGRNILTIICFFIGSLLFAQSGRYLPAGTLLGQEQTPWMGSWPPPSIPAEEWRLVFSDEFDGTEVDQNKWIVYDYNYPDIPNPDLVSHFKPSNVTVSNGTLKLCINKQTYQNRMYTCGGIRSKVDKNFIFERGLFEARIKFPKAWWNHTTFWVYADNGEIDFAEYMRFHGKKRMGHNMHNFHENWPDYFGGGQGIDAKAEKNSKTNADFADDYHIFTAIWDKNFIYFYIDYKFAAVQSRLEFNTVNVDGTGVPMNQNPTTLQGAWYWIRKCFITDGEGAWVILSTGLRKPVDNFHELFAQDKDVPSCAFIDYVRVFQRVECKEDQVIPDGKLFPAYVLSTGYHNLLTNIYSPPANKLDNPHTSLHSIILGTQNSASFDNIIPRWGCGHFKAQSITMLPNFVCYPQGHFAMPFTNQYWTEPGTLFEAMECYFDLEKNQGPQNFVEHEVTNNLEFVEEDEPFDCSDLDTAYLDSILASNNSDLVDRVSFLLDSLGCTWEQNLGRGGLQEIENSPTRNLDRKGAWRYNITIFPNPTKGTFTVRNPSMQTCDLSIINSVGAEVSKSKIGRQLSTTIKLDDSLPPGIYTIRINGPNISHIEKLTILK